MINPQIAKYIADERARGVTDIEITKALLEKGWKQTDIDNAYKAQIAIAHAYGLFKGRLDKGNFLKIVLVGIVLQFLMSALFMGNMMMGVVSGYGTIGGGIIGFLFMGIIGLAIALYQTGATVRRLHDIGQTGWYALAIIFVSFIPFLGMLIGFGALIYLAMTPGDPKENIYGNVPNPNITFWQALKGGE